MFLRPLHALTFNFKTGNYHKYLMILLTIVSQLSLKNTNDYLNQEQT